MKITIGSLADCESASDLVVSIDVLRAFSTAAFAFNGGVEKIFCIEGDESPEQLRVRFPGCLLMGESKGEGIQGFDFNNSPSRIEKADLAYQSLVQRTTSGTPGLVRPQGAKTLIACSLVCVSATAKLIRSLAPEEVFLVATGIRPDGRGDEDVACAEYLRGLLNNEPVSVQSVINRVLRSKNAGLFSDPNSISFPAADLPMVCRVDAFDFAMRAERLNDGTVLLKKVQPR